MKNGQSILIVDDLPQNVELLEAYLSPFSYLIITASSGEGALLKLAENDIDLILLDVMMSGMDGFEVIASIRKDPAYRLLPIILVTALRGAEDRVRGIEAGCDDFISKPVDRQELLARVRSLLKVKAYNDLLANYRRELESDVARRTEELQQAMERIKAASRETIYRLSIATGSRNEDSVASVRRVSRYAAAIAQRLGLGDSTVESILYAAPEAIGARKRPSAEFISIEETIAGCRHERWDGSGYPNGLEGESIPVTGRIMAIAEAFDALTSKRPFIDPLSAEDSFETIRKEGGGHFDPGAVEAFLSIRDEILAVKRQYDAFNEQVFDLPELKSLLQQFKQYYS
jgi:putative two-component system response regulator